MSKCVTCKYCFYLDNNDKAYCEQYGDYIEEQRIACERYDEVEVWKK